MPFTPQQLFFHVSKNTLLLWKNSYFFLLIYEHFFNYFSNLEEMEKQIIPKTGTLEKSGTPVFEAVRGFCVARLRYSLKIRKTG